MKLTYSMKVLQKRQKTRSWHYIIGESIVNLTPLGRHTPWNSKFLNKAKRQETRSLIFGRRETWNCLDSNSCLRIMPFQLYWQFSSAVMVHQGKAKMIRFCISTCAEIYLKSKLISWVTRFLLWFLGFYYDFQISYSNYIET